MDLACQFRARLGDFLESHGFTYVEDSIWRSPDCDLIFVEALGGDEIDCVFSSPDRDSSASYRHLTDAWRSMDADQRMTEVRASPGALSAQLDHMVWTLKGRLPELLANLRA